MTMLGDALRPIPSEGEPGRRRGGKGINLDMACLYFTRYTCSSLLLHSVGFLSPALILYNHIMSCTSCRCPRADSSMFITLMFLSRVAFPHYDVAVSALSRVDYRLRYAQYEL